MRNDPLGERMKGYEREYAGRILMPLIPLCCRIDGKAFHTFTRGLDRPFDAAFSSLMVATTVHLTGETNAACGYTQSDEISLVWYEPDPETMFPFGGKLLKMTSILASMATAYFHRRLPDFLPSRVGRTPLFDCRVWSVPTLGEAVNYLYWRERDATRNSILMAAASVYSHAQMHGKNTVILQDMLKSKNINWSDYPPGFKRGTFARSRKVTRPFTAEELELLPPKHEARRDPGLVVERRVTEALKLPPLSKIDNKEGVLFRGEDIELCRDTRRSREIPGRMEEPRP